MFVGEGAGVGVSVGPGVGVEPGVLVGPGVGVLVALGVLVGTGVLVGVGVIQGTVVSVSWGWLPGCNPLAKLNASQRASPVRSSTSKMVSAQV